ncbi:hypothetical protein CKQ79_30110, partial [Klebsiella pneumoniae]
LTCAAALGLLRPASGKPPAGCFSTAFRQQWLRKSLTCAAALGLLRPASGKPPAGCFSTAFRQQWLRK